MFRSLRNVIRLLTIARILARHDALFLLDKLEVAPAVVMVARWLSRKKQQGRPGQRLAWALHEAGPSFIKLGQALSTRSDLLGEELAADLSELRDRLPPFGGAEARAAIAAEFSKPVDEIFSSFDDGAIAAASIAQVHFAVTKDGREVAVKILRPDIEEAFGRDLDLFFWIAETMEATRPQWRRLRPVASVRTLAETVAIEMDLRFEAAAACELAENFAADDSFRVPQVDWVLTARRVLTTERIIGISFDNRDAIISAGHDPSEVLAKTATAFFRQVFRDGFFHADLHPGNIFVGEDGNLAAVDFGIMGRLDRKTRRHLGEMLLSFLNRDYRRAAKIHFEAGWVPAHQSVDAFTQACRSIAEPILDKPQNEISMARLLGQLFHITETFEMEAQPQLLLLQKTMLVAEGTGRKLSPGTNMWLLTRPLIEGWVQDALGPEARLAEAAFEMSETMRRLPRLLDDVEEGAAALAQGRLKLHPETVRALRGEAGKGTLSLPLWAAVLIALLLLVLIF
ncbi:MAG TPA: 2-polyprenylphenol 6-hydroxylase [Rhodospirillales bacterium]|nr:2-polyprenylphenol 6-hydroxylase [Rhodospirillaceae bacterium]HJN23687.1 2-polyprenylphenol 6-hydroxylase [Rhodospirillales bacterium]